jgi:hypothetical protein
MSNSAAGPGRNRTLCCSLFIGFLLLGGAADARDAFDNVRCGGDIPGALTGQQSDNEPIARIESRHRVLNLKGLGGDEISDDLNSFSWSICGTEYQLLSDTRGAIRDVLKFPAHSRASPGFSGVCRRNGRRVPGTVAAVLDNHLADIKGSAHYAVGDETLLGAKAAWQIDEKSRKFVLLSTDGLRCPRSGIITADGGP